MGRINQDKALVLTDTVQSLVAEVLSAVSGTEAGGTILLLWVRHCLCNGLRRNECRRLFLLFAFSHVSENLWNFSGTEVGF